MDIVRGVSDRRWAERVGLCSVTLRQLPAAAVIDVAATAGVRRIEWGADVHAPPRDIGRLRALGDASRAAGLTVASYGSYWRAGVSPPEEFGDLAQSANALGTGRIRVWAGDVGTDHADPDTWRRVTRALQEAGVVAAGHDLAIALEFHPRTLTDTVDSTMELLERVDAPNVGTYWQPRLDEPVAASVAGLRRLLPRVLGVHVFSWWPGDQRLPLVHRADLWHAVLDLLTTQIDPVDLLLEFVVDDEEARVRDDAQTLAALIERATRR